MNHEIFVHQKEIGQRIFDFIRNNGYSKSSFSKWVDISRPTLDKILEGTMTNATTYEKHLGKIAQMIGADLDFFLCSQQDSAYHKAFSHSEQPIYMYSDRSPQGYQRSEDVTKIFKRLEDVFHLAYLYLTVHDEELIDDRNCKEGLQESSEITSTNLDDILQMNHSIREVLKHQVDAFRATYMKPSRQNPEKIAFDMLNKRHLFQVPIPDPFFGGAIRTLKNGRRIPVINTAQPRLYQYFMYFHELYHLLFDNEFCESHHEESVEQHVWERKADYFAAMMLLGDEVYHYYCELTEKDFYRKIALCMDAYRAPYKAVLVQLYECAEEHNDYETMRYVREYVDRKLSVSEWTALFNDMGLDNALCLPSNVLSWGDLQGTIEKTIRREPEVRYHKENLSFLQKLSGDISRCRYQKGGSLSENIIKVNGQTFIVEVKNHPRPGDPLLHDRAVLSKVSQED